MKKIFTILSMILLLMSSSLTTYADSLTGTTHEQGMRYLIKKGAILPDTNNQYYPNAIVTRGQFASFLSAALDLPETTINPFKDVVGSTRQDVAIRRVANAGIVTGYEDQTFRPNDSISRQHMARMIVRSLNYLQYDTSKIPTTLSFADTQEIAIAHRDAVAIGVSLGIIKGDTQADGIYFKPLNNATVGQAATFVYRLMNAVEAAKPVTPNPPLLQTPNPTLPTTPAKPPVQTPSPVPEAHHKYIVPTTKNQTIVSQTSYATLAEAMKAVQTNEQFVMEKETGRVVHMKSGIVFANQYVEMTLNSNRDRIGAATNSQMEYVSSDGKKVTVSFANQVGTIDLNDKIELIPTGLITERDHYTMNANGQLIHHLVSNLKEGKTAASYVVGKAPAEMKKNTKYYSWNGVFFTNKNDKNDYFDYYNYYQFLPAFSKTNYTAQELNNYILNMLSGLEKTGSAQYKNATKRSKLVGLGTIAKNMEARYGVNALMIISLAINESGNGLSTKALEYNNLFGLNVRDTGDQKDYFKSVEANVKALLTDYWIPNYIDPTGKFANGAVFGSKYLGFNMKYASDPYWGAKAAGHYYRIDTALGRKDAKNAYKIGLTRSDKTNVLSSASGGKSLYQYRQKNYPVIIKSDRLNNVYEIIADKHTNEKVVSGYISKDAVRIIKTTQ
ncbi:MAG: S-layer homology domain-containing protein [Caryophanon sp.]|nr:S-layer homology domain-containing protein [Caryophanon sp.]